MTLEEDGKKIMGSDTQEITTMEEELKTKAELIAKHKKLIELWQKELKEQLGKHITELERIYVGLLLCCICDLNIVVEEFTDKESTKQYDATDESVMKDRFERWMKQYNRRYWTEKEKAMRYENFKISARWTDKFGDGKLDSFADWTAAEYDMYRCPHRRDAFDSEGYMAEYNAWIAQKGVKNHKGVTSVDPENMITEIFIACIHHADAVSEHRAPGIKIEDDGNSAAFSQGPSEQELTKNGSADPPPCKPETYSVVVNLVHS
ncbi:hypothetical protein EJB05_33580, partial [Eragrostis curvula]